jgi:hypothetical protein
MGTLIGKGALALWIDILAETQALADAWYIQEHMPERIDVAGFHRARRYVAVEGAPRYFTLFEADTADALAGPRYLSLVHRVSDATRQVRPAFRNVARMTFEVSHSAGRGEGGLLATLRVTPPPRGGGSAVRHDHRAADARTDAQPTRGRLPPAGGSAGGAGSDGCGA